MKNRFLFIFTPLLLALALTGCVKIERGIEINANNTAKVTVSVALQEDLLSLPGISKDEFYEEMAKGFSDANLMVYKSEYSSGNKQWCEVYGESENAIFDDYTDILGLGNNSLGVGEIDTDLQIDGFIEKTVTITLKNESPLEEDYTDIITSDEFYIKVPSKIITTNGIIDKNDPTKATWDVTKVDFGKQPQKVMTVTYRNMTPVYLMIIAIIILSFFVLIGLIIAIIVIILVVKKKKRSKKPTEEELIAEVELHYNSGTISYTQRCEKIAEIKRTKYYK